MPQPDWPNPLPGYFAAHPSDSRGRFAERGGVNIDTLRSWSQHKRRPDLNGRRACERASFGAIRVTDWLRAGEVDEDGNVGAVRTGASPVFPAASPASR